VYQAGGQYPQGRETVNGKTRCDRCGTYLDTNHAQRFSSIDIEMAYLNGVYCPSCYRAVRAEYRKAVDQMARITEMEYKAAKAGFISDLLKLIFGR
jgi:late competence protein required for DNA uptake (superfamily II DNA/RNA helicase)